LGRNLKLREKYKEITEKWRHHFLASSLLPEHSATRGQKLTFETYGKTLAPPLYGGETVNVHLHGGVDEKRLQSVCLTMDMA